MPIASTITRNPETAPIVSRRGTFACSRCAILGSQLFLNNASNVLKNHRFVDARIVQRTQRVLREEAQVRRQENPADAEEAQDLHHAEVHARQPVAWFTSSSGMISQYRSTQWNTSTHAAQNISMAGGASSCRLIRPTNGITIGRTAGSARRSSSR